MPKINLKAVKTRNTNKNHSIFQNCKSVCIDVDISVDPLTKDQENENLHLIKKIHEKAKYTIKKNMKRRLNLCDLPKDVLDIIVGHINIWHHNRIRATCKTFMNLCDSALMHEYKKSMNEFGKKNSKGYEFVAMAAIQQATWAYVYSGYSSLFLGTMLPLMRNSYNNPFSPPIKKIKKFLKKFYQLVQQKLGDPRHQHSRFLYTLILLGFFKKFENCKLLSSDEVRPEHWRVAYELCGSWFGMLWSSKQPSFNYLTDKDELLLLLTELMISAHSENTFKKVWEGDTKIFVCGHDTSQRKRKPKVIFNFDIQGTKSILNCFKNIPVGVAHDIQTWDNQNINNLPTDEFNLMLKITCTEATKWGCYHYYQLDFGPTMEIGI